MRALVIAVVLVGCGPPPVMLVSDVRVDGHDLVIERCPVTSGDANRSWAAWRSCETRRQRLPIVVHKRAAIPQPPDNRYRRLAVVGDALALCAEHQALHGVVAVSIVVDARGIPGAVEPPALADCIRTALGDTRLAPSARLQFSIVTAEAATP